MYDTVLLAVAAAPGALLWRPLLILGVIAALMALIVVAQMTSPERRQTEDGEEGPDNDPAPRDPAPRDPEH